MRRLFVSIVCLFFIVATSCANNIDETGIDKSMITSDGSVAGTSSASIVQSNSEEIINEFPSAYSCEIGKCSFDIESIDCPQEVVFYSGTVNLVDVDYFGLAEYYMQGREYTILDETGELFVVNDAGEVECGASQSSMMFINCMTPYINSVRYLPEDPNNNLAKFMEEKEFSFGSAEECYSDIVEIYKQYGINIADNVYVTTFYLDHEILAQEEMHLDHNGEDDLSKHKADGWSEDDDAYMFLIAQECQDLPDLNWSGGSAFWEGIFNPMSNASLLIIYNRNGFELVEQRRFVADYSISDNSLFLLSFDDMANAVAEHLNSIIYEDKEYIISNARLYVSYDINANSDEIPLELHWAFEVTEESSEGEKTYEVCFNAVTGEYERY